MRATFLFSVIILFFSSVLQAQYIVKPTYFEVSGVSNSGVVSGYETWAGPYSLWNPDSDTVTEIGGTAPGNGVGGMARFSADGNTICGTSLAMINVDTTWHKYILNDYNYIFRDIAFPEAGGGLVGYSGGQSLTYMGNGCIIKTYDGGTTWSSVWTDTDNRGIEAISFPSDVTGYVGGWSQYFAKTSDGGFSWEPQSPAGTAPVYIYTAICFKDEMNGVVAAQLDDGLGIYITSDGGTTWTPGSGLTSIPYAITHVSGDTYYLVTTNGYIQKSIDNGLTWTTAYHVNGALFLGIKFYDDLNGIATAESNIYKTTDGGQTWTPQTVSEDVLWRDVAWIDANRLILVGTPDIIYESSDGGNTWTWANQSLSTLDPALYGVVIANGKAHVCGSQGTFYKREINQLAFVTQIAKYNVNNQQWSSLGSLGFVVDGNMSSGYDISTDGSTIVGNSWADPATGNGTTSYTHAVAWSQAEGLMDLGSLFASTNRSTRANAVNDDGTVVVGFQDFNGPWKSAVWRKNPSGGYYPNQYLLIDPNGSATDENNQLGMAQAVSGNGVWIGGQGDWANNGDPWLWSETTGYISLGHMEGGNGTVTGINEDGSVVIGYFDMGMWDPRVPFIKIPGDSLFNLNDFVTQNLGFSLGTTMIYTPTDISRNGHYIAGWGFDPNAGEWGEYVTFRLQLPPTAVHDDTPVSIPMALSAAYPNPFHTSTTFNYTIPKSGKVDISIYNIKGQLVRTLTDDIVKEGSHSLLWNGENNDGKTVSSGVYFCKLHSGNKTVSRKLILVK
ncbi:MAG TPA: YCF48-related protein [Candidatus Cloacimonadota bacterium]|nr:YCF48-related protein [Candidatus Cloacimonadota bacterium]HPT71610.1 YCF48-related protein [Candidatus Cloacimonadota bacterium]